MTVYSLLTINPKTAKSCTLVLDSIRTGFPTAKIEIFINGEQSFHSVREALIKSKSLECKVVTFDQRCHHASWIKEVITIHARLKKKGEPMAIVDGDMIFWENCEDYFEDCFPMSESLIAGYYVPLIFNDFAQCVSMPRLHTSFLWIPNAQELLDKVKDAYPYSHQEAGEYCPVDPYGPRVQFIKRYPLFWDTCSTLYNMVGGGRFLPSMNERFTHLNSAAFYDVMLERLDNKFGFKLLHSYFVDHPEELRAHQFNRLVDEYYESKHRQALNMIGQFDIFGSHGRYST